MASIPRVFALQFGNLYLQYEAKGEFQKRVRLTSQFVLSETNFTRFEVVRSQSDRNMVHIRTSYNNKFLRLGPLIDGFNALVASADEPEEDRSKDSCTLFSFFFFRTSVVEYLLFFHGQNAQREVLVNTSNSTLGVGNGTALTRRRFKVIDLTTMVLLPRHVSFRGDNNMYLKTRGNTYLRFAVRDRTDSRVHHIAHTQGNGDVFLLSTRNNRTWRTLNNEWIRCDGYQDAARSTLFRPVRMNLQSKTIALLSRGNNRYCMRWTGGSSPNYLAASTDSRIPQAIMTVDEAIRERLITDIRYDTANARIHSMVPVHVAPQIAINHSTNTSTQTLEFTYETLTEETFSSSHSWKVSLALRMRVTIIPVLITGSINFNASYSGSVNWSETHRTRRSTTSRYIAPVPPRSSARVTLIVERGSIDVPYSYKQRDILLDGTPVVRDMDDGLFTGLNTYQVQFIADDPIPLSSTNMSSNAQSDPNAVVMYSSNLPQHYDHNNDIHPPTSAIPISPENYNDYIVPPAFAIPISPENYNDYIVPPTFEIPISPENYNDHIFPPTSPIPVSSEDSDDEDDIARPSSKL